MTSNLGALRERNFRALFLGQAASVIGDRVVVVTLAIYVTAHHRSASALGLVLTAQALPFVALLLFGGVWADRLPRHQIMLAADLARAALHVLLALLILTGSVPVWEIAAIEFGFGAAQAFFQPAYSGLVPQTVPDELAGQARALTEMSTNLAFFLGPALGTLLVLGAGAGVALLVDAGTFLVSAAFLSSIRPREREPAPEAEAPAASVAAELRAGWREVRSRSWVWASITALAVLVLCVYSPWNALAPGVARQVYGHAAIFGWLETAAGAGAVIGSIAGLRWRPRRPLLSGLALMVFMPLQSLLVGLAAPLVVAVAGALLLGFGFSLYIIWWETALVIQIPPAALSRVSAYDWMGSLAFNPLGYALAAPLAAALGAREVMIAGAALGVFAVAGALVPRATRELSLSSGPRTCN